MENQGSGEAQSGWSDNLYFSTDDVWDDQDTPIGWGFWWYEAVAPGGSYSQTHTVNLPQVPAGSYYLILRVDDSGNVYESNEANNEWAVGIGLTTPDLVPTALTAPASAAVVD